MGSNIDISWWQLAIFMSVLLIPLMINLKLKLHLGRQILVAVTRMTCQLILVGLYLEFLFSLDSLLINFIWLSIMVLVGTSTIITSAKLPKRILYFPVLSGLLIGLAPLLRILLLLLLKPQPLYSAQYLIPLAGMLLGNCISGNIVALQRLYNAFDEKMMEYDGGITPIRLMDYPWLPEDLNYKYQLSPIEKGRTLEPFFVRACRLATFNSPHEISAT